MKGQDILILLKLVSLSKPRTNEVQELLSGRDAYSARALAETTGVGKTEVNSSMNRSLDVGLAKKSRDGHSISANTRSLLDFIVYGIKFVFPARPAELVRGMPTAHAAPIMAKHLLSGSDSVLVWPDATSTIMGQSLRPLYKSVPVAAAADSQLYGYLALVDAIRVGGPRESKLAIEMLKKALRE